MKELILSDITLMGSGYCVIGLEQTSSSSYCSVRPILRGQKWWREPFNYKRGDCVISQVAGLRAVSPHIEDRQSQGLTTANRTLSEAQLITSLNQAEVASTLETLFQCQLEADTPRGNFWVKPELAARSICGCQYKDIKFSVYLNPWSVNLRAMLVLPSGEIFYSLPVVDRDWNRFHSRLYQHLKASRPGKLTEEYLNKMVAERFIQGLPGFARIGLTRPYSNNKCWLMLDSLFPQPKETWLAEK